MNYVEYGKENNEVIILLHGGGLSWWNYKEVAERYMKRCYELAISAGKKGFDTFGAVLVCDGKILEDSSMAVDFEKRTDE